MTTSLIQQFGDIDLANLPPELLAAVDQDFYDNVDAKAEIKTPRICIMQSKSPEIDDQKPGYAQGQLVDNVSRAILSTKGRAPWLIEAGVPPTECPEFDYLPFVVIAKLPTEYVKWVKFDERKEGEPMMEFKVLDKNDPRVRAGTWAKRGGTWGTKPGEKGAPHVTDNINYLIMPVSIEKKAAISGPTIVTFSRTSNQCGVTLTTALGQLRPMRGLAKHQAIFYLYTKQETYTLPNGKPSKSYIMQLANSLLRADTLMPDVSKLCLMTSIQMAQDKTIAESMLNASTEEAADHHAGDAADPNPNGAQPDPFGGSEDPFPG
jgi:hypothetical protein